MPRPDAPNSDVPLSKGPAADAAESPCAPATNLNDALNATPLIVPNPAIPHGPIPHAEFYQQFVGIIRDGDSQDPEGPDAKLLCTAFYTYDDIPAAPLPAPVLETLPSTAALSACPDAVRALIPAWWWSAIYGRPRLLASIVDQGVISLDSPHCGSQHGVFSPPGDPDGLPYNLLALVLHAGECAEADSASSPERNADYVQCAKVLIDNGVSLHNGIASAAAAKALLATGLQEFGNKLRWLSRPWSPADIRHVDYTDPTASAVTRQAESVAAPMRGLIHKSMSQRMCPDAGVVSVIASQCERLAHHEARYVRVLPEDDRSKAPATRIWRDLAAEARALELIATDPHGTIGWIRWISPLRYAQYMAGRREWDTIYNMVPWIADYGISSHHGANPSEDLRYETMQMISPVLECLLRYDEASLERLGEKPGRHYRGMVPVLAERLMEAATQKPEWQRADALDGRRYDPSRHELIPREAVITVLRGWLFRHALPMMRETTEDVFDRDITRKLRCLQPDDELSMADCNALKNETETLACMSFPDTTRDREVIDQPHREAPCFYNEMHSEWRGPYGLQPLEQAARRFLDLSGVDAAVRALHAYDFSSHDSPDIMFRTAIVVGAHNIPGVLDGLAQKVRAHFDQWLIRLSVIHDE